MDAFTPGILLTIIGMGVVFGSLIALMIVIQLLERCFGAKRERSGAGAEDAKAPAANGELEVVLAAAAGYFLETEDAGVRVPKVRRGADSAWARAARPGPPDPWSRR